MPTTLCLFLCETSVLNSPRFSSGSNTSMQYVEEKLSLKVTSFVQ